MTTYPWATRCLIFSRFEAIFLRRRRPDIEERGSIRGGICVIVTIRVYTGRPSIVPKQFLIAHHSGPGAKLQFFHQGQDLPTSNCFKPIWVLTRTKTPRSDDHLFIYHSLPDFLLWCEATFYLTPPWWEKLTLFSCPETIYIAVNPYEFWLAKISSVQLKPIGKPSIVPKHFSIVYPLGPGTEHLFYSKSKNERSVRDVVAAARFSNFKSLLTHTSFDMHKCIYSKM